MKSATGFLQRQEAGFRLTMKCSSVPPTAAVAQLCPACGLCCNGVLFDDVELQRGDDTRKLAGIGVEFYRKGRGRAFPQPCAAFDGRLCRIYTDRPQRCASFDCGLLKRVQQGKMSVAVALRLIRQTRRQVATVLKLLRALGQRDETMALNQRTAAVMSEPIDFSASRVEIDRRQKLIKAATVLSGRLEGDFLQ